MSARSLMVGGSYFLRVISARGVSREMVRFMVVNEKKKAHYKSFCFLLVIPEQ